MISLFNFKIFMFEFNKQYAIFTKHNMVYIIYKQIKLKFNKKKQRNIHAKKKHRIKPFNNF